MVGPQAVAEDTQAVVLVPVSRVAKDELLRTLGAALGVYEAVAIVTGKLPTISTCGWWLRGNRWGKPVLFLLWGWLTFHVFSEGSPAVVLVEGRDGSPRLPLLVLPS